MSSKPQETVDTIKEDGMSPEEELRRKRRMRDLLTALLVDYGDKSGKGAQTALAKAIGLKQAAVSGYLKPEDPESRMTSKPTDMKIVAYLQKARSPKWSEAELITYILSDVDFATFNANLKKKKAPTKYLTVPEIIDGLSPTQKKSALFYLVLDMQDDEKKIFFHAPPDPEPDK